MTTELYKKHRPKKFSEVIGQEEAVKTLRAMYRKKVFPHTLLFSGPSGCGKTTLARIVKNLLKCNDTDFVELDAATHRGIEMVRSIQKQVGLSPMCGDCRI